jgi:iron complex outermembrane receptor protein
MMRSLVKAVSKVSPTPQLLLPVLALAAFAPLALSQSASPSASGTLAPVEVRAGEAAAARQAASVGGLSDAPLAETPQSISVIRAESLRDAGANSLSSAIRSEPSAADFYNTLGYIESLQVRGFLLNNALNYRRDGLPTSNHAPFALENKSSIEILKGLSGIQAGLSAPGGLVNFTLKRPTAQPLREVFAGLSERGTTLVHGDIGGRAGAEGAIGYRINAALEERRPEVRNAPGGREFLSGFFDMRLGNGWLAEAEFESQTSRQISVPGFALLGGTVLPPPIDPRLNLNAQPWSQPFDSRSLTGSLRLQKLLANDWVASVRMGQQRIRTNDRLAFPDGCGDIYPGMCADYTSDLYDYRSESERRTMGSAEFMLRGELKSGSVRHEITASVLRIDYDERFDPTQVYDWVGQVNVLRPSVLALNPVPATGFNTNRSLRSTELQLADVIRLDARWSLWLGLRHTQLNSSSVSTDAADPAALSYSQQFTTPWGAVGYKPWEGGFAYVSAGRGVETDAVPNRPSEYGNSGAVLPALRSRQTEAGLRQQLANGGLASITLFEIDRPLAADIPDPNDPDKQLRVAGAREALHRGVELAWMGRLARDWTLAAQATVLDATTTRSPDSTEIGKRSRNTAPLAAAANLGWRVPGMQGLVWNNRLAWSDNKAVTGDESVLLPAWWQLDSSITWRQRQGRDALTWRAGVDNVFDRRYWRDAPTTYWGGTYLFPAQPRTFRVSVQARF